MDASDTAFENVRPGPGARLRGLATRVTGTRTRQREKAVPPSASANEPLDPEAADSRRPVRRDPAQAPTGAFAACAVPNAQLRVHAIPERGDTWDAVSSFSLSYDGHAYW